MNFSLATLALAGLLFTCSSLAQQPARLPVDTSSHRADVPSAEDSPAQQAIERARRQIKANPSKVRPYNELALAYQRRAREISDPTFLANAEEAVAQGLKADPKDFLLQKTRISLLLSRQDYVHAKEQAMLMHKRTPDDVMLYGYLAEADIALGNYAEAEKSAQWMLNMLANNVPGLMIAARLRDLYGDADGAVDLLNTAYSETAPTEVEELAWIANRIASVQIGAGNFNAAARTLDLAGQLFPHYPDTLENLARVRLAQGRAKDAVELLRQARLLDRDAALLFALAEAQTAANQAADAQTSYAAFESLATAPGAHSDETRLDLIAFYSKDSAHASLALKLARQESATRHDVRTMDALAWALNANGMFDEARLEERKVLRVGIQRAEIFDHAGHIASNLKLMPEAARDFALARRLQPSSDDPSAPSVSIGPMAGAAIAATRSGTGDTALAISPSSASSKEAPVPVVLTAVPFSAIPTELLIPRPTDTERLIHNAQGKVSHNTKSPAAFAELGAAYLQRARETGDVSDYQLSEDALARSLDLVSSDFSAGALMGTMAEVCMGEHRFADALVWSQKALALGSGDVSPFAIAGDAYADMGEYRKSGEAYARLTPRDMTLSPRAAYARDSRISYLKFIAGDTPGAVALMNVAVSEGLEAHLPAENLAWLYYELGEYNTQAGEAGIANAAYLASLTVEPGNYRALAGMAKLRSNQGRPEEAIALYQKAIAIVPMPIFVAELGDLYARSGNPKEAEKQFKLVVYIGLLGHINQVLHNRDLALFYADHDTRVPEALELAKKEFEVRQDVYTWDALAWALLKSGKFAEARVASDKALQFGTRDALLLYHSGVIDDRLGHPDRARAQLKEALRINPHFHLIYAPAAQQELAALNTQSNAHSASNASLNHAP